jgi:hypothetical protein
MLVRDLKPGSVWFEGHRTLVVLSNEPHVHDRFPELDRIVRLLIVPSQPYDEPCSSLFMMSSNDLDWDPLVAGEMPSPSADVDLGTAYADRGR